MSAETGVTPHLHRSVSDSSPASAESLSSSAAPDNVRLGVFLALMSAVGYSGANLALRGLVDHEADTAWDMWVSAMKALPTLISAACLVYLNRHRTPEHKPGPRVLPILFVAAIVMQYGGNLGFQVALRHIGLAISVPLVFAFIIIAGAVLGAVFLGDGVSRRSIIAIIVMMTSIVLLSLAASGDESAEGSSRVPWLGVVIAIVSGLSYGVNGVVIRGVARDQLPVERMLLVYSSVGFVSLSLIAGSQLGLDRLSEVSGQQWGMMLLAGSCNAAAFFAVCNALKVLNITQVNVFNAAQNAMCAVAAVMVFGEDSSMLMILGVVLSIVGLLVLVRR